MSEDKGTKKKEQEKQEEGEDNSENDTGNNVEIDKLEEKISKLEKKLEDQENIAKRAQSDYLNLKMDMDALMKRTNKQQSTANVDSLIKVSKKILPMITQLKQTIDSMSKEVKESQWGSGVVLVFNKMMKSLEDLNIYPVASEEGMIPDVNKHVPISTENTEDKKLKGKIIKHVEQGYFLKNDNEERVIIPAKVIVGV